MVSINFKKSGLTPKKLKESHKEAISNWGKEEADENYLFQDDGDYTEIFDVDGDKLIVQNESVFGTVWLEVPVGLDELTRLIKNMRQKTNEFRDALLNSLVESNAH